MNLKKTFQNCADCAILTSIRLALSALAAVLCLSPLWLYLIARWFFSPQGFWQNLILAGIGLYLLCGIQFILAIILLCLLGLIWVYNFEDEEGTP